MSKGDIIRWEGKYVMVKSLVMQKVHGVVHGGGNVKSGRNNVVGMRFEGVMQLAIDGDRRCRSQMGLRDKS